MAVIVGIAGALRRGSYNAALLRAAAELVPPGLAIEAASIREIPLYDGDLETEHGIPEPVREPKERIAAADWWTRASVPRSSSISAALRIS